ncbi:STAS domain-containing protein [Pseudaeromonas pectinilytica]|jgi:anti-anti-sigma factor|nr:STAS domain-containing protein [Aeromonadaceae bacterium]
MKNQLSFLESTQVLTLEGDFDALACEELTPILERMPGCAEEVLVDMSQVHFIDSSGIGALVFLYKRLLNAGCYLHLVCKPGQPRELLRLLHIDRSVPCYGSVTDYQQGITDGTV